MHCKPAAQVTFETSSSISQVEIQYAAFLSKIKQTISYMYVNLLMKIMHLERKLTDVPPKVESHLECASDVDSLRKQNMIRAKCGFPTQMSSHGSTAVGQMNVGLIEEISKDSYIKHVSGTATPASY